MVNIILVGIIALILGSSIAYMIKEKKKGVKCIGCSDAKTCGGNCGGREKNEL